MRTTASCFIQASSKYFTKYLRTLSILPQMWIFNCFVSFFFLFFCVRVDIYRLCNVLLCFSLCWCTVVLGGDLLCVSFARYDAQTAGLMPLNGLVEQTEHGPLKKETRIRESTRQTYQTSGLFCVMLLTLGTGTSLFYDLFQIVALQ